MQSRLSKRSRVFPQAFPHLEPFRKAFPNRARPTARVTLARSRTAALRTAPPERRRSERPTWSLRTTQPIAACQELFVGEGAVPPRSIDERADERPRELRFWS